MYFSVPVVANLWRGSYLLLLAMFLCASATPTGMFGDDSYDTELSSQEDYRGQMFKRGSSSSYLLSQILAKSGKLPAKDQDPITDFRWLSKDQFRTGGAQRNTYKRARLSMGLALDALSGMIAAQKGRQDIYSVQSHLMRAGKRK